jgi:hypothetical protein
MEKQLDISEIKKIELFADAVFKIKITTSKTKTLTIHTTVEGEYAESVVLDIKRSLSTLTIMPGLTPFFIKKNDKLAAHKVMAIELELIIPENLYVTISSTLASLHCSGYYKYFQAYLESGNCDISTYQGDGFIQTKSGNIIVNSLEDVSVKTYSKSGLISGMTNKAQLYTLEIKTLSGDISILETN